MLLLFWIVSAMTPPPPTSVETIKTLEKLAHLQLTTRQGTDLPELLQQLFQNRIVMHPDGRKLPLHCEQGIENCAALHQVVRSLRPEKVIEIGMAYGVSTLSILSALESNQKGTLTSIDPYINWNTGCVVGNHQVALSGLQKRHTHIQNLSQYALPKMIAENDRPDLLYIDGHHGIEYALVDTFFADKILPIGGVMGFNDVGWQGVHRVIKFLVKYRDYREAQVGLPRTYNGRNFAYSLVRRLQKRSNLDRYFVKNSDWEFDGYRGF